MRVDRHPHTPQLLAVAAFAALVVATLVTGCGNDDGARLIGEHPARLDEEVPRSSWEHYERQLDQLEQRLEQLDEDVPATLAARAARLEGRRLELSRGLDELAELEERRPVERQSDFLRDRDAFEQDLLQLEADVDGIEGERQAATRQSNAGESTGG